MVLPRRRKSCALLALSLAVSWAVVISTPGAGSGQPAPPPASGGDAQVATLLAGRWQLAMDPAAARQRIDQQIERVTDAMLPVVSGIAHRRLRARNELATAIEIAVQGDRIRVDFGDAVFDTPAGREVAMPLPNDPSDTVRVHQAIRNGALIQVFTTEDGRRWNTLTPSADGRQLTFDVVLRSSQLPSDIRYQLPYRAAGR